MVSLINPDPLSDLAKRGVEPSADGFMKSIQANDGKAIELFSKAGFEINEYHILTMLVARSSDAFRQKLI